MRYLPRKTAAITAAALLFSCASASAFWGAKAIHEEVLLTAAVGSAPAVGDITTNTIANIMVEIPLTATDADGDAVIFQLVDAPRMGTAQIENNILRYTPQTDKTGKETFTYCAMDTTGNVSTPATITIKVDKNKAKVTYADMENNPSHLAAVKLAEADILLGERIGTTYFLHPNEPVSRSEFITMASTLADLDVAQTLQTDFMDDQALSPWAKPYISAAAQNGLVSGYITTAGTAEIRGAQQVTLAEASVIVSKLVGEVFDAPITVMHTDTLQSVPAWASDAANLLTTAGVLTDAMGTVDQETCMTRAQACELLYRAMLVLE